MQIQGPQISRGLHLGFWSKPGNTIAKHFLYASKQLNNNSTYCPFLYSQVYKQKSTIPGQKFTGVKHKACYYIYQALKPLALLTAILLLPFQKTQRIKKPKHLLQK